MKQLEKPADRRNGRRSSKPYVEWEKVVYGLFERVVRDHPWDGDVNAVRGLIRNRDWPAVLEATKSRPPQMYSGHEEYFASAQVEHLFKKLPIPGLDRTLARAAFDRMVADERKNRRTNQKFAKIGSRGWRCSNALYTRLLDRMQRFIVSVLGESPDLPEIYDCCDFGPGACVGVGGDATHVYAKLDSPSCTPTALPYVLGSYWSNFQLRQLFLENRNGYYCQDASVFRNGVLDMFELVDYNKIDYVNKNAETHRTTASEPVGNSYVQKGAGVTIAKKLRARRPFLNIWDQTRNQDLARIGSFGCSRLPYTVATLDMKSASQSLASRMVQAVFARCPDWFDFLNRIRSPSWKCSRFNPQGSRYELFVSMGNGFCFPLQTLIFSAAVEAVYEECGVPVVTTVHDRKGSVYGVYGDDIIVDQSCALLLIEWLAYLGVRTNVDKTFVFGPFRESCGADFFNGINVRPYVLDVVPSNQRDLVKIANGLSTAAATPLWGAWWWIWDCLDNSTRRTVRPHRGPDDSGITVPVSFYDIRKLDEYDEDLQRHKLLVFTTTAEPDHGDYMSKRTPYGQMLVALRGATPEFKTREKLGREAMLYTVKGTPIPSFRRKVKRDCVPM